MNLDLTDVVMDPIFQDDTGTLYLRRGTTTVNDQGIATETVTDTPFQGSVQAGGGSRLVRELDAGEMVSDSIQIYTTTILQPGRDDSEADVVLYKGRPYVVSSVQDWSGWGQGFVNATCTLQRVRP